jgi:hypothetical protein
MSAADRPKKITFADPRGPWAADLLRGLSLQPFSRPQRRPLA